MAIETLIFLMLTTNGPSRCPVVEDIGFLKPGGHVTFFAHSVTENPFWMGVLMARFTSRHLDGPKLTFAHVATTAGLVLVKARKWKLGFPIMIELEVTVEFGPALRVVTVGTLVQVCLGCLAMVTTVA